MQYRTVKKNNDKLSILGYGCMRFPGTRSKIDEEKAKEQVYYAIDQGVNYLDTAYPYHGGKSEPFLGKILSGGYRDKVKLATKLPHWITGSKKEMHDILQNQLDNLKTEYIDYYLIHGLDWNSWEEAKKNGVIDFIKEALEQGKIINIGFSFHGKPQDFKKIVDDYDWTFCQIQYNILDTNKQAGTEGLKYAAAKDLAVIIMEPLRGGNLSKEPPKEIKKIYAESGKEYSPAEWALRWIWNHPEVTVVLSGMNDDAHIRENINIASNMEPNSLSEAETKVLDKAAEKYSELMRIGCTACHYCMPCPKGVNIPGCFDSYNSFHMFKDKMAKMLYLLQCGPVFTKKSAMASACVGCGVCEDKCPQQLPIREYLTWVKKDMEGVFVKPMIWILRLLMGKKRK